MRAVWAGAGPLILWPIGLALVVVWVVFRDPAVDYRVVAAGALLPDVVDGPLGGARALHTLVVAAIALIAVMLLTRGNRAARRRWIFLPVGMFLHLVADGMWSRTEGFWWPFFGWSLAGPLPALDHGAAILLLEELAGAVALVWFWRQFRLGDAEVRSMFLRTGRVPREA